MNPAKPHPLHAVVLGLSTNGLAVVRSLARQGVPVLILELKAHQEQPHLLTRYGEKFFLESLIGDCLLQFLDGFQKPCLLFPTTDAQVSWLSEHRGQLPPQVLLLFPAPEAVSLLLNKNLFSDFARKHDLPMSKSVRLKSGDNLNRAVAALSFPLIVKTPEKVYNPKVGKAYVVENREELHHLWEKIGGLIAEVIIQEYIAGDDSAVFFCLQYIGTNGKLLASFTGRKIRQWQPHCGGTASCEPVEREELHTMTHRILRLAGFHGIGSMEYKQDASGRFYCIEPTVCRTDFQAGVALANGVNIPYAAYCDAAGLEVEPVIKNGGKKAWMHVLNDRLAAAYYIKQGRLHTLKWLWSLRRVRAFDLFDLSDPGPFKAVVHEKLRRWTGKAGHDDFAGKADMPDQEQRQVLFITYHYPPSGASGVFRAIRFIRYLPEFGWRPVVLTVFPEDYGQETPRDAHLAGRRELRYVHVHRARVLFDPDRIIAFVKRLLPGARRSTTPAATAFASQAGPISVTPWQRFKDAITLAFMTPDKQSGWFPAAVLKGLTVLRREKVSVIYATGGPWTAFLIGWMLNKLSGLPLVLDFRDPWADNPYDSMAAGFRGRVNGVLEKKCIRAAALVIANTETLRQVFVQKYPEIGAEKFVSLTNGYDEEEFAGVQPPAFAAGTARKWRIMHIGAIYAKRKPDAFFAALGEMLANGEISPQGVEVSFLGICAAAELKALAWRHGLEEVVHFSGQVPKKAALEAMLAADLLLLIQPETRLQVPAKLFEYMRAGKPILALCGAGATRDIVLSENFGEVAEADSIQEVKAALRTLCTRFQTGESVQDKAGQPQAKKYEARNLTARLAGYLKQVDRGQG